MRNIAVLVGVSEYSSISKLPAQSAADCHAMAQTLALAVRDFQKENMNSINSKDTNPSHNRTGESPLKICIVGEMQSGKSSFLSRLLHESLHPAKQQDNYIVLILTKVDSILQCQDYVAAQLPSLDKSLLITDILIAKIQENLGSIGANNQNGVTTEQLQDLQQKWQELYFSGHGIDSRCQSLTTEWLSELYPQKKLREFYFSGHGVPLHLQSLQQWRETSNQSAIGWFYRQFGGTRQNHSSWNVLNQPVFLHFDRQGTNSWYELGSYSLVMNVEPIRQVSSGKHRQKSHPFSEQIMTLQFGGDHCNQDFTGKDLSGANLSGANLSRTDLQGANLSGADLSNANLRGSNLTDANLQGANLQGVILRRVDLERATLSNTNLQGADFWGANLCEADLQGGDLTDEKLRGANFWKANLSHATLTRSIFRGANLKEVWLLDQADLSSADMTRVNASKANFYNANLSHARFLNGTLDHATFQKANLSSADLGGACLASADFTEANMSYTSLVGACLKNAILVNTNLQGAEIQGAFLQETSLKGTNLTQAKLTRARLLRVDLTDAQLEDADLRGTHLSLVNLQRANLKGGNLEWAEMHVAVLLEANNSRTTDTSIKRLFEKLLAVILSTQRFPLNPLKKENSLKVPFLGDLGRLVRFATTSWTSKTPSKSVLDLIKELITLTQQLLVSTCCQLQNFSLHLEIQQPRADHTHNNEIGDLLPQQRLQRFQAERAYQLNIKKLLLEQKLQQMRANSGCCEKIVIGRSPWETAAILDLDRLGKYTLQSLRVVSSSNYQDKRPLSLRTMEQSFLKELYPTLRLFQSSGLKVNDTQTSKWQEFSCATSAEERGNSGVETCLSSSFLKFMVERYGLKKVLASVETGKTGCNSLISQTIVYEQLIVEYCQLGLCAELSEGDMLRIDEILELAEGDDTLALLIQEAEYFIAQKRGLLQQDVLNDTNNQSSTRFLAELQQLSGNHSNLEVSIQADSVSPSDTTKFMTLESSVSESIRIEPVKGIQNITAQNLCELLVEYCQLGLCAELSDEDMLRIDKILELAEGDDTLALLIQEAEYFIAQKKGLLRQNSEEYEILRMRLQRLVEHTQDSTNENEVLCARFNSEFQALWNEESIESESIRSLVECKLRELQIDNIFDVELVLIQSYVLGIECIKSGEKIQNPKEWLKQATLATVCKFSQSKDGWLGGTISTTEPEEGSVSPS